jgi:hypothetical protein
MEFFGYNILKITIKIMLFLSTYYANVSNNVCFETRNFSINMLEFHKLIESLFSRKKIKLKYHQLSG